MGYLTQNISIDTLSIDRALGNIYLSEINGATLDLSMSYTYASKAGDSLLKNDYYTNWQDLDFEVFRNKKVWAEVDNIHNININVRLKIRLLYGNILNGVKFKYKFIS